MYTAIKTNGGLTIPVWVHNFDECKSMAVNQARLLLTAIGKLKLPNVEWKQVGSI